MKIHAGHIGVHVDGLIHSTLVEEYFSSSRRFSFTGEDNMGSLLVTPEEAAAELRIGRSRMYDLIKQGEVVSVRVGGSRRVLRESLNAYVRKLVTEQSAGLAGDTA
jgi:excisionase family DNA binding protein